MYVYVSMFVCRYFWASISVDADKGPSLPPHMHMQVQIMRKLVHVHAHNDHNASTNMCAFKMLTIYGNKPAISLGGSPF